MQEDFDFDNLGNEGYEQRSEKNDSIGNNSGGMRSQRNDDFDMMDDGYEQKMQQKQTKQQQLKDEQHQQLLYGPSNKPQLQNNKQPQISVFDIEQHLSSKSISILTYKKTLETIVQYVNAFSLDELKKFIRLILDLPGFDVTFQGVEKGKKDNNSKRVKKMQMQTQEVNLLQDLNEEISSDISAKSSCQQQKANGHSLPSNGIQTILQIVYFLCAMIDKCTIIQNAHLQQIIHQLLQTESRFYSLPLKPQQLISEISQFAQNSVSEKKYQQIQENIQNAYVGLFQFSNQIEQLREIFYFLLATRCVNNCFRKQTKQNRLSVKMKINCIRILSQLQQGSQKYFNKFQLNKQLQNYIIPKTQLNKLNKQQLQDYSMIMFQHSHKSQQKLSLYINNIVQQLISVQSSIDKKCLGFKLIDKMILNTKLYPNTLRGCLQFLQQNEIMRKFMNDTTHSQLLRKLPPVVKFLYELQKIQIKQIKHLVQSVMKSHQQFYKVVLSLIQYLSIQHLQQVFQFITQSLITKHQSVNELTNPHIAGIIMSIVGNSNLSMINKRKGKKINSINLSNNNKVNKQQELKLQSTSKYQQEQANRDNGISCNNHYQIVNNNNTNNNINRTQQQHHVIVYQLFQFLFNLLSEPNLQPLYTPILCKHLSHHLPLLLPILQQQLNNKLSKPKNYQPYIISILQYMLKLDIDTVYNDFFIEKKKIIQEKQETIKYQFINNLVINCNLYDSIMFILCKKRFDKSITQKCLNILLLATKSYKPLQKTHIQLLWKILGAHSKNQYEKQQFFQFIKQLIKNSINLTQESVKHIYFEIILKLHYDWFTPKIYDCFQMLFMRLNQDGKLLTYENVTSNNNLNSINSSPVYYLNQTQLVGLEKFYYLYFWSQAKVSKKVKDFLYKLYNYKSSPQIKQKLSYEIIHTIMSYLLRNTQTQQHLLHAVQEKDYQQHVMRGFQLFLKFLDAKLNGQDSINEQAMISVIIHNVTRQALPPVKKSLQVNKNMLLKQFKDLIRRQINPPINDIQLINKGKPLKVQRMSLKQLKIQNKNTILVENMDLPPQRKQSQQIKLKQSKQTLYAVFSELYPVQILDYIAEKYLGQQMEKICEWIMDQQKMRQIQAEYKQKKTAKIQQQKQIIIPKKKYSTDTNQVLTFGQILSKQIEVLLKLIPIKQLQSKRYIVDKQWQVIKKMPVNIQVARKISAELDKQHVQFERMFSSILGKNNISVNQNNNINQHSNSNKLNEQLNLQAYVWYIMNRIILRKSDQYKNKLVSDKGLQLFIVGQLQRLICQQFYSYQLYYQLIEAHQSIIQGMGHKRQTNSNNNNNNNNTSNNSSMNIENVFMFGLLKGQSSNKMNNNPNTNTNNNNNKYEPHNKSQTPINLNTSNIIINITQIIKSHQHSTNNNNNNKQSQTILFSNINQVQHSMLRLITNTNVDQIIVEKILSFILYDLIQQQQYLNSIEQHYVGSNITEVFIVNMDKKLLNSLLIKYKQPLLKFYLTLLSFKIYCRINTNNQRQQQQQQQQQLIMQNDNNYESPFIKEYIQVKLLITQLQQQQQSLQKQPKQWLYFLLVGYIQLIQLYYRQHQTLPNQHTHNIIQIFQSDLTDFITVLINNYIKIQRNQLIGLLALINKLLQILLSSKEYHYNNKNNNNNTTIKQQLNNDQQQQQQQLKQQQYINTNIPLFQHFIQFLTNQFIYLIKGVPILTQTLIKQLYYNVLFKLSSLNQQLLIKIVQKIIKFDVVKRNHDHDNIQFRKNDFVGIQNLGCTCYINSLIQQLYHTKLPYKLLTLKQQQGLFQLNHTFMQLYMSTKNAINIKPMIQQVKFYGQQIIPNIQQDVQQFLMSLLDYIESCNGRSIIDSIFGGSYSQQLTYFSQKQQNKVYKKHKQEHFYNITLDIKGKRTLNQALTYFFRSQQLDDKIYCEQLDQKTTVIKRSFIKHFPKILIFTLKRFQFDMENMVRNKLNDYLQFPMELDLLQFSLDKFIKEQQQAGKMEIENTQSIVNQIQNRQQQSHSYQLCGILIHSGSAQTGHYYSYIQRQKKWYEFNDRVVSEINLGQKIKGECFGGSSGGDSKTRNAYMLFYEKVQNNIMNLNNKQKHSDDKIVRQINNTNNNIDMNNNKPQRMQIQPNQHHHNYQHQNQHKMIAEQLNNTLPLSDNYQHQAQHHHGIFLNHIPQDHFFKLLVKDENNHFIKQRLIYDLEYRKFVQLLTKKVQQIISQDKNKEFINLINKRHNKLLADKLQKLQKINGIINPQQQKPIVHFVTNQLMEIQQIKQSQFQQAKRAKNQRNGDFLQDLIQGEPSYNPNGDFI